MHTIRRFAVPAAALVLALAAMPTQAQDVHPAAGGLATQIAPHAFVVTEGGRNLVLITGARESMVVGMQQPAVVAKARQVLATLHAPPVRYAVMMMGPGAAGFGDAGWGRDGALTIAQERLRYRIFGAAENRPASDSANHAPTMGFSEVVQITMGEEEDAHLVHQPAGATDADVAVHFEGASVLYLSSLTTDGYPDLDPDQGGTLGGLIKTVDDFANNFAGAPQAIEPIVPSRGPLAQLNELREFRDMLIGARDAINPMLQAGKTADEVVAAHPTAALDARWGHGPVPADQFVRAAYAALAKERAATH
ncbi:MAG TPA: hypothetical protein VJT67_04390 [Longimicrobiaceae bacterium]|nr:hypothetical protein [Longimicrobiaceae bacterium]